MLDSVEKCSEPRTSRVRVKRVATLLPQCRDASFASEAIRMGSWLSFPASEGDKRGLDVANRHIKSSEPTAGDKRRVLDVGGFHTEDGIEASSKLHTRRRRVLQDESDLPTMQEEIKLVMSFPSLRKILAGNSETNGLAQSVSLTKPEKDALMMQPLEPEEAEFLVFLQNVAQNRLSAQNEQQAAENAARQEAQNSLSAQKAQQTDRLFLSRKIEEVLINTMEKARAKPGEKIWVLVQSRTRVVGARIKAAFFACLQKAAQNAQKAAEIAALNKKSYNRVGGNRTHSIQPIASVGSAFTMWQPCEGQKPQVIQECRTSSAGSCAGGAEGTIPKPPVIQECRTSLVHIIQPMDSPAGSTGGTDVSSDSNVAGGMSDKELIANLAGCAAPTDVRLPAITADESESESESDGKEDGERAAAPAAPTAGASGLVPMESFTKDHVDAFFGFALSELKFRRLRAMLRMFQDVVVSGSVEFQHDGACNVWGFRKVTVIKCDEWQNQLHVTGNLIVRQVAHEPAKFPVASIYEIMQYCGMAPAGDKHSTTYPSGQKKTLNSNMYVFDQEKFQSRKKRAAEH